MWKLPTPCSDGVHLVLGMPGAFLPPENPDEVSVASGFEHGRTPRQIREILQRWESNYVGSEAGRLIIVSLDAVVLDEFERMSTGENRDGAYDRVWVRGKDGGPTLLEEAHDENWLCHFALLDLYMREDILPVEVPLHQWHIAILPADSPIARIALVTASTVDDAVRLARGLHRGTVVSALRMNLDPNPTPRVLNLLDTVPYKDEEKVEKP